MGRKRKTPQTSKATSIVKRKKKSEVAMNNSTTRRGRRVGSVDAPQAPTMLTTETGSMEWERRLEEQQGHRYYQEAQVQEAREIKDDENTTPEGELQNGLAQHPYLAQQRFDGCDPDVNPEPPLNSDARREYDNEKRLELQKKLELQNKLQNTPEHSPGPATPKPGNF